MSTNAWMERMKELNERLQGLDKRNSIERQKLLLQIHLMNMESEGKK